jgi:hypothetical protein
MKQGTRKFAGFIVAITLYTLVMGFVVYKIPNLVIDLSAFAVQASLGYCGICGLFFGANVAEHFASKKPEIKQ